MYNHNSMDFNLPMTLPVSDLVINLFDWVFDWTMYTVVNIPVVNFHDSIV